MLYGLRQTELAGYKVDQNVRERSIKFLHEWLVRSRIDDPIGQVHGAEEFSSGANVRAYALYVLADLGQPDPGLTGALYEQRSKLDRYGLAYLAMALYIGNDNRADARVATGQKSWAWTRVELRDERVALFATYLSPGTHIFTYLARATTAGTFRVLPTRAEMMYAPEVSGRTDGGVAILFKCNVEPLEEYAPGRGATKAERRRVLSFHQKSGEVICAL